DGRLLYVGSTCDVLTRTRQHGRSPWCRQVACVVVQPFSIITMAQVAEQQVITSEAPLYNTCRKVHVLCLTCYSFVKSTTDAVSGYWPILRSMRDDLRVRPRLRH